MKINFDTRLTGNLPKVPTSHHMTVARFVLDSKICDGSGSVILGGYDHETGQRVIVKQADGTNAQLMKEIKFLSKILHPCVIEMIDYDHVACQYVVLPFAAGGDLLNRVLQKALGEAKVKRMAFKILHALAYVHSLGIVHNDIKPDNILITNTRFHGDNVVLADFGLACELDNTGLATGFFGTECYSAPEKLAGLPYGTAVDIWALGVTLFACLFGLMPYNDETMVQEINSGLPILRSGILNHISPDAADLILKMLSTDPSERISAMEAMSHPWFADLDNLVLAPPDFCTQL